MCEHNKHYKKNNNVVAKEDKAGNGSRIQSALCEDALREENSRGVKISAIQS